MDVDMDIIDSKLLYGLEDLANTFKGKFMSY